jgi:crotonobetainyl-CoA:carnitine CoA-transferase CaiB-like acyl-CoA transferase
MNLGTFTERAGSRVVSVATGRSLVPAFGPLQGLRVVDTGRFVAGPWAATHLAEFGAEVIHVEAPPFHRPYADPTRSLPPLLPEGAPAERSVSESWVQYSRNKLSLGLDLRDEEGRVIFLDLLRCSDIWIESSRPGTFDKLGLSDGAVLEASPRLTVVHVSGYGQTGVAERLRAPSYDLVAQAYSGFLSLQGPPAPAPPMRAGTALNDTVTGLAAAGAALMGHIASQRTGRGQVVDVAQYEVFFTLLENLALDYFMRGVVRGRYGNAHQRLHPYDLMRARDGWVVLAAPSAEAWRKLKPLLGVTDPRWDDMAWRTAHREVIDPVLERFCSERTVSELEQIGKAHDCAISRIYDIADIAEDPHYAARGMFVEWDDPVAGPVKGAGIAPRFVDTPGRVWRGAPWLGQDNARVLGELLGYPEERRAALKQRGVVGEDPPRGPAPARSAPMEPGSP